MWPRELALALAIVAVPVAIGAGLVAQPLSPTTRPPPSPAGPGTESILSQAAPTRAPQQTSSPSPAPVESARPTGKLIRVAGVAPASGPGPVRTFSVEVEQGLPIDRQSFAEFVQGVMYDPRGWGARGTLAFRRTDSPSASFTVTLSSPATTDRLCAPLVTAGRYSCHQDGRAVLNYLRWTSGAPPYKGDLVGYRTYMINHEVGHALGHGAHNFCTTIGAKAPLMMQQTKGVDACKPNPWPLPFEREVVAP